MSLPEHPDAPAALGMSPSLYLPALRSTGTLSRESPVWTALIINVCGALLLRLYPSSQWLFVTSRWCAGENHDRDAFLHSWGRETWRPVLFVIPMRSLRKPQRPGDDVPSTHMQPYHSNPTEFLKIYSVISMSPVAGGEVKHSDACGITSCFFSVSFKRIILISFF